MIYLKQLAMMPTEQGGAKMEKLYDAITLNIAEGDRMREGKKWMQGIVDSVSDVSVLSDADKMYYHACIYVLAQTIDQHGEKYPDGEAL